VTTKKTIQAALEHALLHGALLSTALCESVLIGFVDELEESLHSDADDALIAFVVEGNEVAMLLIEVDGSVRLNDVARERLHHMWKDSYATNIKMLMPTFVDQLRRGMLAVGGIKWTWNQTSAA
jgi:hypothetical protein